MSKLLFFLLLASFQSLIKCADYTNYKVYEVTPDKDQIKGLKEWELQEGIDFWSPRGIGRASTIMVSPKIESKFLQFLKSNKIMHKMTITNVEEMLRKERQNRSKNMRKLSDDFNEESFKRYWTFDEMEQFADYLVSNHGSIVKKDLLGTTFEGRNIFGLKISNNLSAFGEKPIIFIDAGTHAREWVGHAAALYLIHKLVNDADVSSDLLSKVDWVIIPNVNPDGYVYSFTEDRFWRKNRRYINSTCTGIDLNRNYAYEWKYIHNSCTSLLHPGPFALSEEETLAVARYMDTFKTNFALYLATHSYGPMVLWPFGFEFDLYINNWRDHQEAGEKWKEAVLGGGGEDYEVGNSADILYTANGASDDYAIAMTKAKMAYTLELPGGGTRGFDFPEEQIYDLVKSTFLGYQAFGHYIAEKYNSSK